MSVVLDAFKDNQDHRILKIHLFDDSINRHGWGIDKELAASLAQEYAQGAPYLIHPTLNHPVRPYPPFPERPLEDIQDIRRFAAPYKAGECFKTEPCTSNHSKFGFDGYVKLTDPKAIEAFDKNLIPRYASVAFYELGSERNAGYVTKATALNICAVRVPAWSNAQLLGICKGDESSCHTNLKNAGITVPPIESKVNEFIPSSTGEIVSNVQNPDGSFTFSVNSQPQTQPKNDYCILKTLEKNNYKKFKTNTSLKQNSEYAASYTEMSATTNQTQQPPQQQQPVNTNNNVQPTSTSSQPVTSSQQQPTVSPPVAEPVTTATEVTNVPQNEQKSQQAVQQPQVPKPVEDVQAKEQIEEILDYKKLYEELKPVSEQKDALLLEYQKRINRYEKDHEALKTKEIDRFVTIDLFNGDSKTHGQKVKEWHERAGPMTLDDLTWHLTESYGRKVFGEKKAGLNFEPTAVLANSNSNPTPKRFSIYDIGSIDLNKAGGGY